MEAAQATLRGAVARFAAFSPPAREYLAYSLLAGVAVAIYNLVFNLYMSALGFSNDLIGVFNALPAVGLLLVGLPFAALADRIGYRLFLLGGASLAVVASIVLALVSVRLIAVLAAGSFGLALIVFAVLGGPLLAQVSTEAERVALFAVSQALSWVSALAGNLLGGAIPEAAARLTHVSSASAGAMRWAFAAMAVLTVVALPLLVRLARRVELKPAAVFPIRELLQVDAARFARLLLPILLLGIGAGMYLNFLQLYLAQRFGLTAGPIGVVFAVGAALTAVASLLAPSLGRRLGLTRTIGVSPLIGAPLVLALAFLMILPVALVIITVRQLVLNLQGPLSQAFGMAYVEPRQRARYATAQIVVSGIGLGGIGPLLSGFLQVRGGYQLAFSVSAAFYLLAGLTFLLLFGRVRLPSERPVAR
ncbi:MAG TPA: MFS transporter [Candidatus Binatus sp.]|nr:MFS transporter [Candidatus Binatus sp.]